jgi:hypothetical protein
MRYILLENGRELGCYCPSKNRLYKIKLRFVIIDLNQFSSLIKMN